MGIDRIHTTLPTYTSLQRRGRVRKGKGSSDDNVADESQNEKVDEQKDSHATGKRISREEGGDNPKEDASQEDASTENSAKKDGGHIDEHV
jgi:hypothetical protein